MAVRSRRGLRSIFSRGKYGNLGEKPIRVVDADDEDFMDGGCSFDRIIVCKSTDMEETKDDDDDDYIALTEKAAYAVVRDASALTELIASRMHKINCVSEQNFEEEKEEEPIQEEAEPAKTETQQVSFAEPAAVEAATEPKPEEAAASVEPTNKGVLATTKDNVAAVFEACISGGKDSMTSAEESSQAAITLPLTPFLEQMSERLEAFTAQVALEAQEFYWDHWNMLQNFTAAVSTKFQKVTPCGSIQNVVAENPSQNTTIEVQMATPTPAAE